MIVSIHRLSLWEWSGPKAVLVLPGRLEHARLQAAVERAVGCWPTVEGRYVRVRRRRGSGVGAGATVHSDEQDGEGSSEWEEVPADEQGAEDDFGIALPPRGPGTRGLVVEQHDLPLSLADALPTMHVEQERGALEPFLPVLPAQAVAGSAQPLCLVRHTTLQSGHSVLGAVWSHVLGDASSLAAWLRLVSASYVDPAHQPGKIELSLPVGPMPVPTAGEQARWRSRTMTPVEPTAPAAVAPSTNENVSLPAPPAPAPASQYDLVRCTVSPGQLDDLRRRLACRTAPSGAARPCPPLSTQDLLTAWWLSVLERIGRPLSTLTYVINARPLLGCPAGQTWGSNAVPVLDIPIPSPLSTEPAEPADHTAHTDLDRLATLAHIVRAALLSLRPPSNYLPWLHTFAYDMHRLFAQGLELADDENDDDGGRGGFVNPHLKLGWTGASFGRPEREVRFHYAFSPRSMGTLHTARANGGEGYEVSFRVPQGRAGEVGRMMRADMDRWATGANGAV